MLLAGVIDGRGPFAGPTNVLVSTDSEAVVAVDRYASLGYQQIKIYSSVPPAVVPAIIARAHALGLRVSGHVPAGLSARRAVELGYDELQHANFLMLNFLGDSVGDTRTARRVSAVGEWGAGSDTGSAVVQAFLGYLKERGTVLDPTLNAFERLLTARRGELPAGYADLASSSRGPTA